ncbi:NAD(P)/FAD-dependent oxidoreductase [Liquorilactobacillus satsumensis]|uniref:NAD(P)/FAD-dependent oxidoreductase n=1 Tax=Liquorilactobacillus satsumensis TaxID=259059 RepID=UPI001E3BA92C|nr:FAD-dependent oxidoreductase [Liquorilactobacillus satsumensis]MCC7666561.1 reductase [Liquorilactobacillus satsumensis]MCP9357472.1 FAD-dependent oxidoreductase [Liquorilactobacillus satsumensis]MCP9371300.1 FAD-dependent oxidoreductase [Liquorilactobacillus satsumensis]
MAQDSKHFKYLLIGGGMAADKAAAGIRTVDQTGTLGIISADSDAPYARPALSKKLWVDPDFKETDTDFKTAAEYKTEIFLNTTVTAIDPQAHTVTTADGTHFSYDKLLLATGSQALQIPGPASDLAIALRSKADYRKIRAFSGQHKQVLVVGSGYVGSEIAAGLIQNDTQVTMVISGKRIYEDRFPGYLSEAYQQKYLDAGIKILTTAYAKNYEVKDGKVELHLASGKTLVGDGLVLGIGGRSNFKLGKAAGLATDHDGIIVDEQLKTSAPDIWAAGDIISYPDKILGRQSSAHVNHAVKSGMIAGKSMAGAAVTYDYTPSFYSWVFDISWDALGHISSQMQMYAEKLPGNKSVVYYFDEHGLIQGILSWNSKVSLNHLRHLLKKKPTLSQLQQVLPLEKVE